MRKFSALETASMILIAAVFLGWMVYRDIQKKSLPRSLNSDGEVHAQLQLYGETLTDGIAQDVLSYTSTTLTMRTPMIAYVVNFTTNDPMFFLNSKAATDKMAYAENTGKRIVWEEKFCSERLKRLIQESKINIVTGVIKNTKGESQFAAICNASRM